MDQVSIVQRPKRREYSVEFNASVLEQCRLPGASLAGIALGHGINPNMVHRWIREERQRQVLSDLQQTAAAFVPLQLSGAGNADAVPMKHLPEAPQPAYTGETIHIEIQRSSATVSVRWPLTGAAVMSLIQSARMNGHVPYAYLKDVLTRLPTRRASQIGELLPHRWRTTIA